MSIESCFKDMVDEVQYVVSMRRHTPVYDDFSKLFSDGWLVSEPLPVFKGETLSLFSATSEICDRCGKICTSEEFVQFHSDSGPCQDHPRRMLSGGLYSHWLARTGGALD